MNLKKRHINGQAAIEQNAGFKRLFWPRENWRHVLEIGSKGLRACCICEDDLEGMMAFRLSGTDIRQLAVFKTVVECNGFTSAQAVLNVGQSTISGQMAQLETRLGVRLCERGRTGFELTAKGRIVYEETLKLLRAHEEFQSATAGLKGRLSGHLAIGVVDNVVFDPLFPLVGAIERFNQRHHQVGLRLEILTPVDIERQLLEKALDLAIGTFHHQVPGLVYRHIYVETNELLCATGHPIYAMTDPEEIGRAVEAARKVTRGYLERGDLLPLGREGDLPPAVVHNLEAAAILILSGGYIGFLPRHYSQRWISSGEIKPIAPETYVYRSPFSITMRRTPRTSLILKTFVEDLETAVGEICSNGTDVGKAAGSST